MAFRTTYTQWSVIAFFLLLISSSSFGQVTIGSELPPNSGALLDLKEYDSTGGTFSTASRGMVLPRVALIDRNKLDPIQTESGESEQIIKERYTGLILYNVGKEKLESLDKQLCPGIHVWTGTEWFPLFKYPETILGESVIRCVEGPGYTVVPNSIKVFGLYAKNTILDASHYVEVTIDSPANLIGGEFILQSYSPTMHEFKYEAKGKIQSTRQVVKMLGTGKVETIGDKHFTLVTNSPSEKNKYPFTVPIVMPTMRIVGVGNDNYNPASAGSKSKSYQLMMNPNAFGNNVNALVKVMNYNFEYYVTRTSAQWIAIFKSKPDMVIRTYNSSLYDDVADAIKEYVEAGGVFIDFNDNNNTSNAGVKALYGSTATSNTNSVNPGILSTFLNVDDEIMKGPFSQSLSNKTLSGKNWREDASYSQGVTNVPIDKIVLYSQSTSNGKYVIFRDKSRNYFYVGDGGFLSGAAAASSCCYPFQLDSYNMPTTGYQGEGYNSYLFGNIMAWALNRAALHGINQW